MNSTARQRALSWGKRVLSVALAVLLCLFMTAFALPERALAYYNNVSGEYPASRDLNATATDGLLAIGKTIYPSVIFASDIVDGTYVVPAYTSSRMCNLYSSLENATSKFAPNQAVLTVSGGVATLTFYLSGAYTALYFGSGASAASLAPAGGMTASSAYITDGSLSYDTGHGPFSVQLQSLNTEFSFAVFNGGSRGIEAGMWYDRLAAVIATDDFVDNYCIGVRPAPSDDDPEPTPGGNEDGGGSGGEQPADPAPTEDPGPQPQEQSEEPVQQAVATLSDGGMRGIPLTIVSANDDGQSGPSIVMAGALIQVGGLSPGQIAAIACAVLAALGAVLAVVRFRLQLRGPRDDSSPHERP